MSRGTRPRPSSSKTPARIPKPHPSNLQTIREEGKHQPKDASNPDTYQQERPSTTPSFSPTPQGCRGPLRSHEHLRTLSVLPAHLQLSQHPAFRPLHSPSSPSTPIPLSTTSNHTINTKSKPYLKSAHPHSLTSSPTSSKGPTRVVERVEELVRENNSLREEVRQQVRMKNVLLRALWDLKERVSGSGSR